MAYTPPLNVVRSLSPITELTTPASARSIALPLVDKPYDYKDESPIHPNIPSADRGQEEDDNDDQDSTFSHGSNRTVVPSSTEPSPLPVSDSSSPLPSPPSTIRAFSSPTTGLPPPPRPIHSRGDNHSQPTTPQSSALQLDPQAIRDLKTFQDQVGYDTSDEEQEEDDEMDRASVSTAGMAGIGSGIYSDAVKQKKHRPKSLHNTSHRPVSPISSALPSVHASLINIPNIPSLPPTPLVREQAPITKTGRKESPPTSRPSSPKSRPSTLKKRPQPLQTSRPTSWHSPRSSRMPKNSAKKVDKGKGKPKNRILEIEGSASSNDDLSETIKSPPLPARCNTSSPRKRIPSILLSLFDTSSARQSRTTSLVSLVSSPTSSDIPRSPASPSTPSLNTIDEQDGLGIASHAAPQAAIRLSGTFGIRDDGSVHLLDDGLPPPRMSTSSTPSRPDRERRNSDNGTVKSGTLGRILYVNNRDSIDETEENEVRNRSFTPFEPDNPVSPLEAVLGVKGTEGRTDPERKSVEVQRELLLSPGRSDVSQRAQSPSTAQPSISTTHEGAPISRRSSQRVGFMVDESTQTSVPPSPAPSRRPLPRPPSNRTPANTDSHHSRYSGTASNSHHSHTGWNRTRPTSLPPRPLSAPYPQPRAAQGTSTGQTPELPLLIASHLLSTHAATLMRQSAELVEGAEVMKRMADESMQWGAMLLSMASSTGHLHLPTPPGFPSTATRRDREPVIPPERTTDPVNEHGDDRHSITIPTSAASISFDPLYLSRPIFHPPPPPRPSARDRQKAKEKSTTRPQPVQSPIQLPYLSRNSGESDRYTRLPPRRQRTSSLSHWATSPASSPPQSAFHQPHPKTDKLRSSLQHDHTHHDHQEREVSVTSGFYEQVDNIGKRGFDELHKAEAVWINGMRDLRSFLDTRPESPRSLDKHEFRSSTDHHPQEISTDKHTREDTFHTARDGSEDNQNQNQSEAQDQKRRSRLSTSSARRRSTSIRRALSTSSGVRSDESFLPQSADLGGPSTGAGTARTDESFLPQSADLMTPIDDSTIRPRPRPRIQTRPTLCPPSPPSALTTPPISADIRKERGYDSSQVHTVLSDGFRPFDHPHPQPPFSRYQNDERHSKETERYGNGPPSAISTGTAGRKLRKRASATSELREQEPNSADAGTFKSMISTTSKKRHWWSRRSRVSRSGDTLEPVTAY